MKISIIVPVYKVEKYLCQCVDSVLNQTYRHLELILVDDGSPDNCPQICDEYAHHDKRVKVIHKANGGLSSARNAGVAVATGEYGLFLDSDDYWDSTEALERLVERHQEVPTDVLNFAYYKLDERTGNKVSCFKDCPSMPKDLPAGTTQIDYLTASGLYIASACNKMVSMHLLKELPFEVGKVSEDIVWTAKLMSRAISHDYLNIEFYCYRQRTGSIAHSISSKSCSDLTDAIIDCCNIMAASSDEVKVALGRYTAYQYSTFIATQAFAPEFQKAYIQRLKAYQSVLQYYSSSRKVKYMYYGVKILGLTNWCRIIRRTRRIWDAQRDKI